MFDVHVAEKNPVAVVLDRIDVLNAVSSTRNHSLGIVPLIVVCDDELPGRADIDL